MIFICFGCIKLTGVAVIVLAIWMLLDPTFYTSVGQNEENYYAGVYTILAVGVIIFLIGILGCCGAYRESPCMLMLFNCFLLIIIVAEIIAVLWCYKNQDNIEKYVRESVKTTVQEQYGIVDSRTVAFDSVQKMLQCCGVNGPRDWAGSRYNKGDRGAFEVAMTSLIQVYKVPPSCCRIGVDEDICKAARHVGLGAQILSVINSEGCIDAVVNMWKKYSRIVLGTGVGTGILDCLGLVWSLMRCCCSSKKNSQTTHPATAQNKPLTNSQTTYPVIMEIKPASSVPTTQPYDDVLYSVKRF